nr:hypothetical protein [Tanacetum cinerariifolium]
MNQDSYNSNSLGFDQPQPPQSPVIHQPPQELSIQEMEDLKQQYLDELKHLSNLEYRDEIKIAELTENFNGMSIKIQKKEKLLQEEHSEVMEIVILEVRGIDDDILLTIKQDVLREKLLNVNLFISKIEALNANPTPSFDCKTSLPPLLSTLSWRRLIPLIILYPSLKLSALMLKRLVVASLLL